MRVVANESAREFTLAVTLRSVFSVRSDTSRFTSSRLSRTSNEVLQGIESVAPRSQVSRDSPNGMLRQRQLLPGTAGW